jgi:alkylated DNA repair dioxygenase AlkB
MFNTIISNDGMVLLEGGTYSNLPFSDIVNDIVWQQDTVTMYGKTFTPNRKTCWQSTIDYAYGGKQRRGQPWTPLVKHLADTIGQRLGTEFIGCVCNLYPDGSGAMGWHSDDEPEMADREFIVSISFGATRRFSLRHNTTRQVINVDLNNGDMLVMVAPLQQHWQHCVRKTTATVEPRINLTFR